MAAGLMGEVGESMENTLGIMGGMGPLATQLFYRMLIEHTVAEKDQDHVNVLIVGHATMPDRTQAILSGNPQPVYEKLHEDIKALEAYGCRAIAVPCNTSHYFLDRIEEDLSIPIIHMIRESAKEAAKTCRGSRVGILATDGTIQTELYQKALAEEDILPYVPSPTTQRLVMHEIYDCVKNGRPADLDAWREIETELREAGCRKALLACTELSVVKEQNDLGSFYIDAMEILAIRSVEFMGKRAK